MGDDSGFLERIHPLSYLDVDVAAHVSDEEEGLYNDHVVGNVPEVDPHVLEVEHQVIEVVVDDVYGHVVGPFAGVIYCGVDMDIEAH